MTAIYPLDNPVQTYPWGSRTAIAELLGQPLPAPEPQAELWLGAHPRGTSRVETENGWLPLDRLLEERGEEFLGSRVLATYGGRLPFLLKVLAARCPLSIQAHPNRAQARAGFARETAAGLAIDAPARNYRDRNHKPEILHALTPFTLLRGFREPDEIADLFARAGLRKLVPELAALDSGVPGLRRFFRAVSSLEAKPLERVLGQLLEGLPGLGGKEAEWIGRMAEVFPGDRGLLAPLYLQLLRIDPGQAVYTGPGVLHAYLDGMGVELMANSDNVLRGGCTSKHVDVDELVEIVRFEVARSGLVAPLQVGIEQRFVTPADEFVLGRLRVERGDTAVIGAAASSGVPSLQIFLCTEGEGRAWPLADSRAVVARGSGRTEEGALEFRKGSSFLVPAAVESLAIEGSGVLFRARIAR